MAIVLKRITGTKPKSDYALAYYTLWTVVESLHQDLPLLDHQLLPSPGVYKSAFILQNFGAWIT